MKMKCFHYPQSFTLKIKESQQTAENSSFSFKVISKEEVENAIKDLPINKSTISGDIWAAWSHLLQKTGR